MADPNESAAAKATDGKGKTPKPSKSSTAKAAAKEPKTAPAVTEVLIVDEPEAVAEAATVEFVEVTPEPEESKTTAPGPSTINDTTKTYPHGHPLPYREEEPRQPLHKRPIVIGLAVGTVFLLALCLIAVGITSFIKKSHTADKRPTAATSASYKKPAVAEPTPFTSEGAKSWTEWMAKANAQKEQGKIAMWQALADLHFGGSLKRAYAAVQYQAVKESVHGLDYYVRTVPAGGLHITNTSPKGKKYVTITGSTLLPGDRYLVLGTDVPSTDKTPPTKEKPAIRVKCGNPIKVTPSGGVRSVKGPDTTNGAARQKLRDKNAVRTPTPGYTGGGSGSSGTADRIAAEQKRTAGSTTNNGQVGHSGSIPSGNSSGETNNGGGASVTEKPKGDETPYSGTPVVPN